MASRSRQLDADIAQALAEGTRHREGRKARLSGYDTMAKKTLKEIAALAPYGSLRAKKRTPHIAMLNEVSTAPFDESGVPNWIIGLGVGGKRPIPPGETVQIPFGHAYIGDEQGRSGDDQLWIYLPTVDQHIIDVAVDAIIEGKPETVVRSTIGQAIGGRGGLVRDAYVALAATLAEQRMKRRR